MMIRNGLVLTMDDSNPIIDNGCVIVKNGVIDAVGKNNFIVPEFPAQVIDADGGIIMPGLINCHTHLPMALFRGLADDLPLEKWLHSYIFPAEAEQINPETVYHWALHSCQELLLSGVTTCCDGYFHEDQVAEAVLASGIRAILGQGVIDFPAPGVPDPSKNVDHANVFAKNWMTRSSRIKPSIFCHSPYTCSASTLQKAKQTARDLDILFQIHTAETRDERNRIPGERGISPVAYLAELGILDKKTLLVHGVWLEKGDVECIQQSGASIAHCPESNMKLASGVAPVCQLIDAGIPVGLGTDGSASNNNLDMLSEMDSAVRLHALIQNNTGAVSSKSALKMATVTAARAVGLDGVTGVIRVGGHADIVVVNTAQPHLVPLGDPYDAIVLRATGADIRHVIVDGILRVRDGRLVN